MGRRRVKVEIPYTPRRWQREVHKKMTRFSALVVHRRGGKTVLAINDAIRRVATKDIKRAKAGYVAPTYRQAKRIAWNYLLEFTKPIPGMIYKVSELTAIFPNGAELSLYGADNPDSMRGEYQDHVVLDEVAQMSPRVWTEVIRPLLADRKGSATFIGTPMGRMNLFYDLYKYASEGKDGVRDPEWSAQLLTVDDTGVLEDTELQAARRTMSEASYRQEFYCDWSANVVGSFYGDAISDMEKSGRIHDGVVCDPSLPVIPAWDLGLRDATVITYWQTLPTRTYLIECDAFHNTSIPDIAAFIQANRPWSMPYHIGPHDLAVRDIQSADLTSRFQAAAAHGINFQYAPRRSREDGIATVQMLLPRVEANKSTCRDWLEAMRLYRAEYNDTRRAYARTPVHDWTSDYADSTRYFALTAASRQVADIDYNTGNAQMDMIDRELERIAV